MMTNLEFFELITKYKNKVNPLGATAQCSHETRYRGIDWNSNLWKKANNPAGIKSLKGWTGDYINSSTWEQNSDGTTITDSRRFLKFDTVEDGIKGYVKKIEQNYPLCVASVDNIWGYLHGLFGPPYKWATDKNYFNKLVDSVIRISPVCLGNGWEQRLYNAYQYAVSKNRLSNEESHIVIGKLKQLSNIIFDENTIISGDIMDASLKDKRIVIDPGHGLPDSGAVGFSRESYEMDITLAVAKKLRDVLVDLGADVKMTREDKSQQYENKAKDLQNRCDISNNFDANAFLSIHCNSATNCSASGFEAFTSPGQTKADKLCNIIYQLWEQNFPDMKIRRGNLKYTIGKEENLYVLKHTKAPAVLVELGFISNSKEEKLLLSDEFQTTAAKTLSDALVKFLAA